VVKLGRAMEMIEVDGLRITYERAGSGPPLVLLHGYAGDGPTTWRHQLEGLGDDFTLIAWNAPGVGGSSDPPESFGMAGYADSLAGFIAALGLEAPHVAGLSPDEFVGTLLPTMFSEGTDPAAVEAFGAAMRAFHPIGFRAMARASAENLREVLPRINVPTLLIYGAKDVRAPLPVAEDLEASILPATLVVLPDAGHVCNIEAPEEFNQAVRTFLQDHPS
jgi:pimeloyl-ACP methyl ester carboxylesterase